MECDSTYYSITQKTLNTTIRPYESCFFFESLEYTYITQIPKTTLYDFISSIGGSLSLFVGLSFVSFFEIIEIIIEVTFILFQKTKISTENEDKKLVKKGLEVNRRLLVEEWMRNISTDEYCQIK